MFESFKITLLDNSKTRKQNQVYKYQWNKCQRDKLHSDKFQKVYLETNNRNISKRWNCQRKVYHGDVCQRDVCQRDACQNDICKKDICHDKCQRGKYQNVTDLSETERQKTPGSLYHIQQKQIFSVRYMVHIFVFSVFSIHRRDLPLLNMVQGTRSFLSFCFW